MVQIPRSADQPPCQASCSVPAEMPSGAFDSLRVLLIDASAIYGKALSHALSRIPRVEIIGTVKQAREVHSTVIRLRPELVILDLAFGKTGAGRGLLQELTALTRAPKVIVLTDDSGPLVTAHVLASGAFAHFDKSLETAALINQVTLLAGPDH